MSPTFLLLLPSFLVAFLSHCNGAKILFTPLFGSSHYFVFKKVAIEVARRGHEVGSDRIAVMLTGK